MHQTFTVTGSRLCRHAAGLTAYGSLTQRCSCTRPVKRPESLGDCCRSVSHPCQGCFVFCIQYDSTMALCRWLYYIVAQLQLENAQRWNACSLHARGRSVSTCSSCAGFSLSLLAVLCAVPESLSVHDFHWQDS